VRIKVKSTRQRGFYIVYVIKDASRVNDSFKKRRIYNEPVDGAAEHHAFFEFPHINPVLFYCDNTIPAFKNSSIVLGKLGSPLHRHYLLLMQLQPDQRLVQALLGGFSRNIAPPRAQLPKNGV
jgi:hypothetical protein